MPARDDLGRYTATIDWRNIAALVGELRKAPDRRLEALRKAGYTPDGIDQILAYGADHGIADPLLAAQRYEAEFPMPTAVAGSGGRWDGLNAVKPLPVPDMSELLAGGNDEQWTNRAVAATLRELRSPADPSPILNLLTAGFS